MANEYENAEHKNCKRICMQKQNFQVVMYGHWSTALQPYSKKHMFTVSLQREMMTDSFDGAYTTAENPLASHF